MITFHETRHRYDRTTLERGYGEVYAIIQTATKCQAWTLASNSYKNSQAKYAKDSFNIGIDSKKNVSQDLLNSLNKVYKGVWNFELVNNRVELWIPEILSTIKTNQYLPLETLIFLLVERILILIKTMDVRPQNS